MFIYVITNSATGKIYIGQHKGNNLKKYLQTKMSDAAKFRGGSSRLYNSMRKHPKEVWSIAPLFEGIETREELNRIETLLIALYDTRNPQVGYNICKGGEGFTGKHSPEARKKSSEAAKSWYSDPANAEGRKAQRIKLSEQKKEQYANHWFTKVCPVCKKEFTLEPNVLKRVECCSHRCAYQLLKNDPEFVRKREEDRKRVMQKPEYTANLAAAMAKVHAEKKQAARDAYYANPNHCILCGSTIDIKNAKICVVRKREFCSRVCSNRFRRIPVLLDSRPRLNRMSIWSVSSTLP